MTFVLKRRECQDANRCRSSTISKVQSNCLFRCNGSNYPTDYAPWVRMDFNIKQLIYTGVLLVSGWPAPHLSNLSSWVETNDVIDRTSFRVMLSLPPRSLKYLEVTSTDHQVAFRVPRDSCKYSALQTEQLR